ncbi:MAG TPA: hypothetical protein VGW33_07875 [Terriglobia bacterium]|nr:hypothetical protein [Terriglobia bacterium]
MPDTKSQKALILEYCESHALKQAGQREIRLIQAELRRALGADHRVSASYVANVLRHTGLVVGYEDRYVSPVLPEPYAARLEGALEFRDLESAEASLRKLDALHQEYRAAPDPVGVRLVRALVLKGKQRAESLARNPRVKAEKRREKQELAGWFRVWLESPDLFFDWLGLRRQSEEFRQWFESSPPQP